MLPLITFITFLFVAPFASAAIVTYNWNVGWIEANPDGRLVRPVIAINGQFPPPLVSGNVGDQIVVNVNNNLGNESMTIHWHGIFQMGNNHNDGTPMVAQCPIIPGTSYTYNFTLDQPGTYWYHSHSPGQYMDGLRGPLIINDPNNPYKDQYDSEIVMWVSDWYHDQAADMIPYYIEVPLNPANGSEPVPPSALLNDKISPTFNVVAGKTYFLRIINMSGFAQFYFHIDQHAFNIIEIDGVYTDKAPAGDLYIATGQRYGVLMQTKPAATKNYAIMANMDLSAFDPGALAMVPDIRPNVTGALVYNAALPNPPAPIVHSYAIIDDFYLVPLDGMQLLRSVDQQFVLGISFFTQNVPHNQQYRSGFNNDTYIPQKVPSLYTVLSAGNDALDKKVYGHHTNPLVLHKNNVIELVFNNYDTGVHPLHIHGHNVQLVARGPGVYNRTQAMKPHNFLSTGVINTNADATALGYSNTTAGLPAVPMRRDTWLIAPSSYTVIRFQASNPGTWFIHCHMEWHMEAGLLLTLIEAPLELQATQPNIPAQMQSICEAQNIPLTGNAAGNNVDYLNLTGAIRIAPPPRGALYP